jgi:uncharacterized membrane protein
MGKGRIEAFSDGVIAIIITIMVLELKVPHGEDLAALAQLWPTAMSYVLSFIYVGIYWNNHHHMLQATRRVNGAILWWNLHLLFWLSLLPFSTGWMGENHFARWPTVLYGVNLFACALAWFVLQTGLVRHHGPDSLLAQAMGHDVKTKVSPVLYFIGLAAAWLGYPGVGLAFFAGVALIWLIPDRRVERLVAAHDNLEER